MEKRIKAEKEAERIAISIPHQGNVNVIRVVNKRMVNEEEKNKNIEKLANQIASKIVISGDNSL